MDTKDIFHPENKTIKQIFGESGVSYHIPIYQRPYSWNEEIVEKLWDDILEAYQNNDKNYFLGSLVVIKNQNQDFYDVVDGQQRLTTLIILFCVLRDLDVVGEKQKNIVINSIKDLAEDKERLKLTTHLNNQALFDETILKKINFQLTKKEQDSNIFIQTAYYFKDFIEKSQKEDLNENLKKVDLNDFINYLFNKTTIIRIVCSDEIFAIKLFSILNDRGLDLNAADIIKAYLLQKIAGDHTKSNSFIEVWKQIEGICKNADEKLQDIFSSYLYYLKPENPKKALQDELKEQFKDKDPQSIILDVKKFAENILEITSDTKDRDISLLRYLKHSVYWKSILATAKHVNYPSYQELKSLLVKYYYQSWIADGTSNRIKQTSFNILKAVKGGEAVKPVQDISEIKKLIVNNIGERDYLTFLDNKNAYNSTWHKPVLLAIEYYLHEKDKIDFIPITNDLHTEHILPKEWNKEGLNWVDKFIDDNAKNLINKLGNLTLLSGTKNIRASNCNFSDKKEIYSGNHGRGFDGKTSFEITKRVIDNNLEWGIENINKRHAWIIDQAQTIFSIY